MTSKARLRQDAAVRTAKRAGWWALVVVGGAIGGYLATLLILVAAAIAWNILSLVVRIESQDFGSDGWTTFGGVVALLGAVVGVVIAVQEERRDGDLGGMAAIAIGAPALGLVAFTGFMVGMGWAGEALFGSFGWGVAAGFAFFFIGCLVGGLVYVIWWEPRQERRSRPQ
jgi:hypothetical protein